MEFAGSLVGSCAGQTRSWLVGRTLLASQSNPLFSPYLQSRTHSQKSMSDRYIIVLGWTDLMSSCVLFPPVNKTTFLSALDPLFASLADVYWSMCRIGDAIGHCKFLFAYSRTNQSAFSTRLAIGQWFRSVLFIDGSEHGLLPICCRSTDLNMNPSHFKMTRVATD